jgi:hypothetical protein
MVCSSYDLELILTHAKQGMFFQAPKVLNLANLASFTWTISRVLTSTFDYVTATHGTRYRKDCSQIAPSSPKQIRSKVSTYAPCLLVGYAKQHIHPGNKKDNITVIYTPWSNLLKDGSMAAGQVSFKDPKKVSYSKWLPIVKMSYALLR